MNFEVNNIIIVNGLRATVTKIGLAGRYGNDSIEYRYEDGTVVKDDPSLSSYYGGREYIKIS